MENLLRSQDQLLQQNPETILRRGSFVFEKILFQRISEVIFKNMLMAILQAYIIIVVCLGTPTRIPEFEFFF